MVQMTHSCNSMLLVLALSTEILAWKDVCNTLIYSYGLNILQANFLYV